MGKMAILAQIKQEVENRLNHVQYLRKFVQHLTHLDLLSKMKKNAGMARHR